MVKQITKKEFDDYIQKNSQTASEMYGVPQEEVLDFFKKRYEMLPEDHKTEDSYGKALTRLLIMAKSFFKKSGIQSQEIEVIFIGKTQITDYGKTRAYDEAVKTFKTDPKTAIAQGLTNDNGEPIYQSGFNVGKVIDKDDLFSRNVYGVVKTTKGYKKIKLTLRKTKLNEFIPLFVKLKMTCGYSHKPDEEWDSAYSSDDMKYEILDENWINPVDKFKNIFKKELEYDIDTFVNKTKGNYNAFMFMQGVDVTLKGSANATVVDIQERKGEEDVGGSFDISDEKLAGLDRTFTGFMSEDPAFIETVNDAIVIGRPYEGKDGKMIMQVYGVFVDSRFRKQNHFNEKSNQEIDKFVKNYNNKTPETSNQEAEAQSSDGATYDSDTDW